MHYDHQLPKPSLEEYEDAIETAEGLVNQHTIRNPRLVNLAFAFLMLHDEHKPFLMPEERTGSDKETLTLDQLLNDIEDLPSRHVEVLRVREEIHRRFAILESENASLNSAVSSLKDQVKALIAENTAVATSHQNLRNENDKLYRIANDRLVLMRKLEIENARLVEALEEQQKRFLAWIQKGNAVVCDVRSNLGALMDEAGAIYYDTQRDLRSTQPPSQTER